MADKDCQRVDIGARHRVGDQTLRRLPQLRRHILLLRLAALPLQDKGLGLLEVRLVEGRHRFDLKFLGDRIRRLRLTQRRIHRRIHELRGPTPSADVAGGLAAEVRRDRSRHPLRLSQPILRLMRMELSIRADRLDVATPNLANHTTDRIGRGDDLGVLPRAGHHPRLLKDTAGRLLQLERRQQTLRLIRTHQLIEMTLRLVQMHQTRHDPRRHPSPVRRPPQRRRLAGQVDRVLRVLRLIRLTTHHQMNLGGVGVLEHPPLLPRP